MISKTFIERPKFAMVVSIVITLAGLISIALLPIAEFPQITPPQVSVTTAYPGANAQTLVDLALAILSRDGTPPDVERNDGHPDAPADQQGPGYRSGSPRPARFQQPWEVNHVRLVGNG